MKHILFVNNNMHIGGVQKALLNLLWEMHTEYEITLLLFYPGGEYMASLPADVHVITASAALRFWGMSRSDAVTPQDRLGRAFWAGLTRLLGRRTAFDLLRPLQRNLSGFDAAISFLHSGPTHTFYGGCNEFVLHCVQAPKKITFLHCDYARIQAACAYNQQLYHRFDAIAACSNGCRTAFLQLFPELKEKTLVVPNCQNYTAIRRAAQDMPVQLESTRLNVLTVARLGREKGVLRAIRAIAALGPAAAGLRYYIIGNGIEYPEAERLIAALALSDTVELLGEQSEPYGYMQATDLLLIPSVSEAAPMVIGEAACLGTPILTTETSSAREMVEATGFGWVCENSVDGIRKGLLLLLSRPDMLQEKRQHLQTLSLNNNEAREAFLRLVD